MSIGMFKILIFYTSISLFMIIHMHVLLSGINDYFDVTLSKYLILNFNRSSGCVYRSQTLGQDRALFRWSFSCYSGVLKN